MTINPRAASALTGPALDKWQALIGEFNERGGETLELLAIYCEAYGAWVEAVGRIDKTGYLTRDAKNTVIVSPWVTVRDLSAERMESVGAKLGLLPREPAQALLPPFAEYVDV